MVSNIEHVREQFEFTVSVRFETSSTLGRTVRKYVHPYKTGQLTAAAEEGWLPK